MGCAALGGDGIIIPGRVQEAAEGGIQCHGPVHLVVLRHRLHSIILEVFSNLNESVILRPP